MTQTVLVAGASRGIGLAVARHRASLGDRVVSVSRAPSPIGRWLACDIATREGCAEVASGLGGEALDALLFIPGLLPNLRRAAVPRIVLMGSLSGLPNRATVEVANTASKFGLQGVAAIERIDVVSRSARARDQAEAT